MRSAIEATDSEDAKTLSGYIVWTAERVELLGGGQVQCYLHLADLMLVARSGEVVLIFRGLRELGDRPGLLVLTDPAPTSPAGRSGEPYERLEHLRLSDGRWVFAEPFEPDSWEWLRL